LAFKVLDASAFYAGIPFASPNEYFTTSLVYDEIKHIKKNHDALGILLETKRLKIIDPKPQFTAQTIMAAKMTGDYKNLSKQDLSSISLCLELGGELITDDFAVSNVSKTLGIKAVPVMTLGIKVVGKWIYFCPGCHKNFSGMSNCPLCGNKLRKKLRENATSFSN
jgi:UPF0271 protein